jgi:hypothetical protein
LVRAALAALVVAVTTTTASAAPPSGPPVNVSPPTISGSPQIGQSLTADRGSWTGKNSIRYSYIWQRCDASGSSCVDVAGANGSGYTVSPVDAGHTIRVAVTATNKRGQASAVSAATAPVVDLNPPPPPPPPPSGGLHVVGNQLQDANNARVFLHGVNYSGAEYACIQGWGIFDGPSDAAMITAMRSWNINVVHLGLNEDCILGINGVPTAYAGANYMNAIVSYVNRLHAQGIYAEVSLMWAAPGTQKAQGHPAILDQDHSSSALAAIANAFKSDPKTMIGLQSEPHNIGWACWRDGGSSCSVGYAALGMQAALNAVRGTGATNVVTASGIDWANNLTQWLTYRLVDPAGQLAAEAHLYDFNSCGTVACLDSQMGPVAASVPLVFGEIGDDSCANTYLPGYFGWIEAHASGEMAWAWDLWGDCLQLISDFSGTPRGAYGLFVKSHYLSLP